MVWRTFAFVMGLMAFTTSATLAIGSQSTVSVAIPIVTAGFVVVALGLVRNLLLRAFRSIQLADVLTTTTDRAHQVVEAFYPDRCPEELSLTDEAAMPVLPPLRATVCWPELTAVVEQLDIPGLTTAATRAEAVVVMLVPVGATIQRGTRVAEIRGGDLAEREVVRRSSWRGADLSPGPGMCFRLLAASGCGPSPAVNDPATAVEVLDALQGLLSRLASMSMKARFVTDDKDDVRVILRLPTWTYFLHVSLDDLLAAATRSPMVLIGRGRCFAIARRRPESRCGPLVSRLHWIERELADRYRSSG